MEQIIRKINRGYQFTIPPEFREQNSLDVGALVSVKQEGNKLVIEPFKNKTSALKRLDYIFSQKSEFSKMNEDIINAMVSEEIKASRKSK